MVLNPATRNTLVLTDSTGTMLSIGDDGLLVNRRPPPKTCILWGYMGKMLSSLATGAEPYSLDSGLVGIRTWRFHPGLEYALVVLIPAVKM